LMMNKKKKKTATQMQRFVDPSEGGGGGRKLDNQKTCNHGGKKNSVGVARVTQREDRKRKAPVMVSRRRRLYDGENEKKLDFEN